MKPLGLLAVVLLLLSGRRCSGMSHPKPACRYPPSQWCRSLEIAIQCHVQKQCMEVNATRLNHAVPPVSLTLYYESLCPACRVFITQQLFPTWTMLQDIMTVTLVPYGNAKEIPSENSPFTCQHGEPECRGNMIEACIIRLAGHSALQIIYCMESSANVLSAAQPVQKQCMEVNATRLNHAVPPVSLTLYYESLCPACRVFITQQLFPTWTMLQDIMTVTLVPYGNAKEIPSENSPFTCQHGEPECRGNMIEACIIRLAGHSALQIIYCMESSANVLSAAQPCLQLYAPSVSWSSVDSCVKGSLGRQLIHANAAMTRALNPPHTHVPWVTFNGEYTEENEDKAMSSLFHLVCQLYIGVKPPACTGAAVRLNRGFC